MEEHERLKDDLENEGLMNSMLCANKVGVTPNPKWIDEVLGIRS